MTGKKNWFVYVSLGIFELFAIYAVVVSVRYMAGSAASPLQGYVQAFSATAAGLLLAYGAARLTARLRRSADRPDAARRRDAAERYAVAAVILASAAVRVWIIEKLPIAASSDYLTYYQVADLLAQGKLAASGYSGYIAEFPHVIGFPFLLSLLFRITGPSLQAGLYMNLLASLCSIYLVYRIARLLGGRLAGMIALVAAAFWPSQILYGTILASEPVFTLLILLCIRLFIELYRYPARLDNREGAMYLCFALGVLIALANAVRPLATVLLIAVVLCLLPYRIRFDDNDRLLNGKLARASCQGWFAAVAIILSFVVCGQLLSSWISNKIAYPLPGVTESYGYNLMVGVNAQSKGAWNQQDADFFAAQFAATNSASAAHSASIGVALSRIRSDAAAMPGLAREKFGFLWENDNYAATWTTLFLDQQSGLTPERQAVIRLMTKINQYFYLLGLFFSAVLGIQLLAGKEASPAQAMILLFIGTAMLHMALECQNRYHYFILPVFAVLASLSIAKFAAGYTGSSRWEPGAKG